MAKQHLVENFSKDWSEPLHINRLALNESSKIVEAGGKKYPITEGFEVPTWRLGVKNLNGRIYSKSLGEKVVRENKNLVTVNLADHPTTEGSVKDIWSVSKNPHIREGIMYVDMYPVDEAFEKKLNKMLELGAGLGVSSSCYGDIDESTSEVIEEGFEVERFADWVLSPSFQVYVTNDCRLNNESVETDKESIKENLTISNMPDIKEQVNMSDKLKESLEKATRLNLVKIIEDADKKETIVERLSALEEALSYTADDFLSDMKKNLEEKITKIKEESLVLAEKGKTVETLNEGILLKESEKVALNEKITSLENDKVILEGEKSALQKKLDESCKLLDEAKKYSDNAVELLESSDAEVGSKFSAKEYIQVLESAEKYSMQATTLQEKVDSLSVQLSEAKERNRAYKEKNTALELRVKELREAINDYTKEIEDDVMNEEDGIDYNQDSDEFDYGNFTDVAPEDELELDVGNDDDVEDYYDDLVTGDPRYESIKVDILKCKTVFEAQKTVLRLKPLIEKLSGKKKSTSIFEDAKQGYSYVESDVKNIRPKGWL